MAWFTAAEAIEVTAMKTGGTYAATLEFNVGDTFTYKMVDNTHYQGYIDGVPTGPYTVSASFNACNVQVVVDDALTAFTSMNIWVGDLAVTGGTGVRTISFYTESDGETTGLWLAPVGLETTETILSVTEDGQPLDVTDIAAWEAGQWVINPLPNSGNFTNLVITVKPAA